MKKVSIITINLNNAAGLRATAESIISQSCYNEIEWIVIDGASTDGSVEDIYDFAPYIHYWVSEKDSGIYHAMNKGILAAHGEYVLFRNSGDLMSNNRVIEQFIGHPAYGKFAEQTVFAIMDQQFNSRWSREKVISSIDNILNPLFSKPILYPDTILATTSGNLNGCTGQNISK